MTSTQNSGSPLPLPMRTSVGFLVTGFQGNVRIQSLPRRFMMPGDRDAAGLDLPGGQPARLEGLEAELAERQRAPPLGLAPHPAALVLAELDFLGHQHG